jgi:RNA-directed DNA polymerase
LEVLADHSTEDCKVDFFSAMQSVRWGTITLRTHCREGEVRYDTLVNGTTGDTLRSQTVSLKLYQLRTQAKQHPKRVFTTLHHLVDIAFLREAYRRTRKDAAKGADEVTAKEYAEHLESNLKSLYIRFKEGSYVAPFVLRVWIDKEDGSQRPIGIPSFEDKILQRAVSMILSAIYEVDFYDFSYGFRENRSPHDAIKSVRDGCYEAKVSTIIDADVSKFFDAMSHDRIREFLRLRTNDGKILQLIGKWLNAGVIEDGNISYPSCGSPQGGVISPLIANIFLHHVLDGWFVESVQPKLKGKSFLVRFADDFILGCEVKSDARKVMRVLYKRFARFGLTIHPDKSKMIHFRWPSRFTKKSNTGTFDFLGFTHFWGRSRNNNWVVKRQTMRKRQARAMRVIYLYCQSNKHEPLSDQLKGLRIKLIGLYNYYGIRCNYRSLWMIYQYTRDCWRKWLSRRSNTGVINWEKFEKFLKVWKLPEPTIVKMV